MILDLMKNFENIRRTKNNRKKTKNGIKTVSWKK